jgi:hypothetical protein
MKVLAVTLFVVVVTGSVSAQNEPEPAPTAAQCSADARLWAAQIDEYNHAYNQNSDHNVKNTVVAKLSANELNRRAGEMKNCFEVGPDNWKLYTDTAGSYNETFDRRAWQLLMRHGLKAKF